MGWHLVLTTKKSASVKGDCMDRQELKELHYITPIANVPSILEHGLPSHKRVQGIVHESVAMSGIQDRRRCKKVPHAQPLHDYVNLYFHARNHMLYNRNGRRRTPLDGRHARTPVDSPGLGCPGRDSALSGSRALS